MKKFLVTILSVVYLSSSMGATIHLHFCMGKLASWSLINHESKKCAQCGMVNKSSLQGSTAKNNCCKDEHRQIKTGTDQKLSPADVFKFGDFSPAVAINNPATQNLQVFSLPAENPKTNSPPLFRNLPRFILYRNFRI